MRRSKHSLSHYNLVTANMGALIPIGCVEALPGDTFQHSASALIRLSPQLAPVMHPVVARIHHFFVPNRLVWDGWEDFITGVTPDDEVVYPTIPSTSTAKSLLDYMGVPNVAGMEVSALPIRAYNLIFNEWYRDQDLVAEVDQDSTVVQFCMWGRDYFSGARPWPQKGEEVVVPLGDVAPVYDYDGQLKANLEEIENSVDVREFRKAFAMQRYQEARARYGSRYTEYLRYLGITPSDARLQRPEYLGGGRQAVAFSEVLRTGNDQSLGSEAPIGELNGHGIAAMRSNRYRKFFEEHGHVISVMSVRPKAIYGQNLHRKWSRRFKEDYFQKELQDIGQQEVYNREVWAQGNAEDDGIFGYVDRYREYREEPSEVCGEFRDVFNYWHMGRDFESLPVLNHSFVECQPTKRIFAEQTQHCMWIMVNHSLQARRMVKRPGPSRIL